MVDDGLAVSVGNAREQVSDGGVDLGMIFGLRLWNRLRLTIGGEDGQLREVLQAGLGLFDNGFSDVMADAVNLTRDVVGGARL